MTTNDISPAVSPTEPPGAPGSAPHARGISRRGLFGTAGRAGLALTLGAGALTVPSVLAAPPAAASNLNGPIGRQEILDRAWHRFHQRPAYSWYSATDGFRNDCSGYVSYAWNTLPQGNNGWTTYSLPSITHRIPAADLQAGDILLFVGDVNAGTGHVQVFIGWADPVNHARPIVLEHGGPNGYPPEHNTYNGILGGYYPARYNTVNALDPYGTIRVKWLAAGGSGSDVGNPTLPEMDSKRGGRFQQFQHGMIIWNRGNNQAWMVHGAILEAYRRTGSEEAWGFPIMDEYDASPAPGGTTGRFQKFEGALILWSEPTGAHIVHGEIRTFFEAGGYEKTYGYPTSDEIPEGNGFRQTYQQGTIHWNPTDGARWEPK